MTAINSRRFFLAASICAVLRPEVAVSSQQDAAVKVVDKAVSDINQIINSGDTERKMLRSFEKVFNTYADVPTIAKYALGRDVRTASALQINDYTKAFSTYFATKYGKRFREFIGGTIEIVSVEKVKKYYLVNTIAHMPAYEPFDVDFLVSEQKGRPLIFNLIIEGVNMLLAERQEIGALLDRNSGKIDTLIGDLKSR
jgi:phospholipid transport system substrate-binding protein